MRVLPFVRSEESVFTKTTGTMFDKTRTRLTDARRVKRRTDVVRKTQTTRISSFESSKQISFLFFSTGVFTYTLTIVSVVKKKTNTLLYYIVVYRINNNGTFIL